MKNLNYILIILSLVFTTTFTSCWDKEDDPKPDTTVTNPTDPTPNDGIPLLDSMRGDWYTVKTEFEGKVDYDSNTICNTFAYTGFNRARVDLRYLPDSAYEHLIKINYPCSYINGAPYRYITLHIEQFNSNDSTFNLRSGSGSYDNYKILSLTNSELVLRLEISNYGNLRNVGMVYTLANLE